MPYRLVQMEGDIKEGDRIGNSYVVDVFTDVDGRQWVLLMGES